MFSFRKKSAPAADSVQPALALITEDEPILRLNATSMLEEMGFTVLGANTAAEALEHLEHNDIELLITDIHMPGDLDGLALARAAAERWPDLRIVLCSGRTRVVESQLPPKARFVDKPYTMDDIEGAILSL